MAMLRQQSAWAITDKADASTGDERKRQ